MTKLSMRLKSGEVRAIDQGKYRAAMKEPKDMISFLNEVKDHCNLVLENIEAIEREENAEAIDLYITIIEESCDAMGKRWIEIGYPDPIEGQTVRGNIRNGDGDFIRIQKKCIDLGLV